MKPFLSLLLAAALVPAAMAALPPAAPDATPAAEVASQTMTVELRQGEEHSFYLDSNRTTGYGWQVAGQESERTAPEQVSVKLVYLSPVRPDGSRPLRAGGPGYEKVTLTALKPGRFHLVLHYVRPWEKPLKPVRRVVVEGVVTP